MNGAPLALGFAGLLVGASALSRQGGRNASVTLRVDALSRDVLEESYREGIEDLIVVQVQGRRQGLLMLDVQDILRDRIEDSGDEDGEIDRLHRELHEVANFFDGLIFPLTVYRGVLLSGPAQAKLDRKKLGDHWTPDREVALRFARGQHDGSDRSRKSGDVPVLLVGQILSPRDVDWRKTFALYFAYSVEFFHGGVDPERQIQSSAVSLIRAQEV